MPVEGRLVLTKGGVFSHYEFVQPLSERLTDEAWRQRLDAGDVPPLAPWTSSFMVAQTAEQALEQTIIQFNADMVQALWFTEPTGSNMARSWDLTQYLSGVELEDTLQYIEQLRAQEQFVGMQRIGLQFLSFDLQDAQNAIVTTRERWSDTLYRGAPSSDPQNLPIEIGMRPSYETVVTYTMTRQDDAWKISRIVPRPEPPEWEQP
ncbi:MAG: DUF3160 domain-containing protein [Chloroflexales bacterium]|nr:DUF3160 domain-containing protein [Chloroflexales bacterium]